MRKTTSRLLTLLLGCQLTPAELLPQAFVYKSHGACSSLAILQPLWQLGTVMVSWTTHRGDKPSVLNSMSGARVPTEAQP